MDWVTQKNRKEKVVEMMRNGDWRQVIKEFHGDDKYREPLLVWIRPTLHCLEFIRNSANCNQIAKPNFHSSLYYRSFTPQDCKLYKRTQLDIIHYYNNEERAVISRD